MNANALIQKLGLIPLPGEGGYFRQTFQSKYSTAIYYLLTPKDFSAFHRLVHDEVYHFYYGDSVELVTISESGTLTVTPLGTDFEKEFPQTVVTGGVWQASRLKNGGKFALLGTTMAPAWKESECEFPPRNVLLSQFPQHQSWIQELTRQ